MEAKRAYPGSQALPRRVVPGLPPQVHGPAGDALPDMRRALHVKGVIAVGDIDKAFRSRLANRARRWRIDWRSARRWKAAEGGGLVEAPRKKSRPRPWVTL